jgi:hypothetical protein
MLAKLASAFRSPPFVLGVHQLIENPIARGSPGVHLGSVGDCDFGVFDARHWVHLLGVISDDVSQDGAVCGHLLSVLESVDEGLDDVHLAAPFSFTIKCG